MTVTPDLDKSRTSRSGHGRRSPTAATLHWLEEAHESGPLPAYVRWLVDQPLSATPFVRVPEQAEAAATEAMRSQPREVIRQSIRRAIREAVFLVVLVLRLNATADEAIRLEGQKRDTLRA